MAESKENNDSWFSGFGDFDIGGFLNDATSAYKNYGQAKESLNKAEQLKAQRKQLDKVASDAETNVRPVVTVTPSSKPVPGESKPQVGGGMFDNPTVKYGAMALGGLVALGVLYKVMK